MEDVTRRRCIRGTWNGTYSLAGPAWNAARDALDAASETVTARLPFDNVTVADVLRTRPPDRPCGGARTVYDALRRRVRGYAGPCQNWGCAACAPAKLQGLVAHMFMAWGDRPVLAFRFADLDSERAWRRKRGVTLRGENADPAYVSVPVGFGTERVVFYPDARGLTGKKLGRAVVETFLRMPIPEPRLREPDPDAERDPDRVFHEFDRDLLEDAAARAGFALRWHGPRRWASATDDVTREQWEYFKLLIDARPCALARAA